MDVAQWLEFQIVDLAVAGSNPVIHPLLIILSMTIALCGSTNFYDAMDALQEGLEEKGFEVFHPRYTAGELDESIKDLHKNESHKSDMSIEGRESKHKLIISHLKAIEKADAILVVNLEKGGNANYIGGNTFLEMGFALALGKQIYVWNELPKYSAYYDELTGMLPIILNQSLEKVTSKNYENTR